MKLINSRSNGATEKPGTSADALFVFLAGPIRYWWGKTDRGWSRWWTPARVRYFARRKKLHRILSRNYLVYSPHRAWRGPWNELAQDVNDLAVAQCHVLVRMYLNGVHAEGTRQEAELARMSGVIVISIDMGRNRRKWRNEVADLDNALFSLLTQRLIRGAVGS